MARQFDSVIYGDGVAALCAGYKAAKQGLKVLQIKRNAGGNNTLVSVDVAALSAAFGKQASESLAASKVVENRFLFLSDGASSQLSYRDAARAENPAQWLMPLSAFEAWVQTQAEAAGMSVQSAVKATEMMLDRNGRLQALRLEDGEIVRTKTLLVANGGEHLVIDEVDANVGPDPRRSLSATQSFKLDAEALRARFLLEEGEAVDCSIIGNLCAGRPSRAWLKSNGESVEIGLQMIAGPYDEEATSALTTGMADLTKHASLAILLKGASAAGVQQDERMITGFKYVANIFGNGWLLAGRATRLADPLRADSMANELQCGLAAADAIGRVLKAGDTSKRAMGVYHQLIEDSFVMENLKAQKNAVEELEKDPSLMSFYSDFFNRWFGHDTEATLEPRKARNKLFFKNMRNERPVWEFAMGMRKGLKLLRD